MQKNSFFEVNINISNNSIMEQPNEKELEQAKENLKLMLEAQANVKYEDWDNVIVQLMNGDEAVINSRIMRQDIEALANLHAQERKDIIDMLITAMENEVAAKKENN